VENPASGGISKHFNNRASYGLVIVKQIPGISAQADLPLARPPERETTLLSQGVQFTRYVEPILGMKVC